MRMNIDLKFILVLLQQLRPNAFQRARPAGSEDTGHLASPGRSRKWTPGLGTRHRTGGVAPDASALSRLNKGGSSTSQPTFRLATPPLRACFLIGCVMNDLQGIQAVWCFQNSRMPVG